jgi:hypothetical protein
MTCERCGSDSGIEHLGNVVLCETCLMLVLIEWRRHREEFGELQQS